MEPFEIQLFTRSIGKNRKGMMQVDLRVCDLWPPFGPFFPSFGINLQEIFLYRDWNGLDQIGCERSRRCQVYQCAGWGWLKSGNKFINMYCIFNKLIKNSSTKLTLSSSSQMRMMITHVDPSHQRSPNFARVYFYKDVSGKNKKFRQSTSLTIQFLNVRLKP